jgi:tRNA 2-thiouridine synthesizing protein E
MLASEQNYVRPGEEQLHEVDPDFPHAPAGWSRAEATARAEQEGLVLTEDHWKVVRSLQDYYARHADDVAINVRELHDALDEKFHVQGGIKYVYEIFPKGPVAQGCRLAGLEAPAGAVDRGFGSVV